MTLDRRRLLSAFALTGLAVPIAASAAEARAHRGEARFLHGVASGDPAADRLILWTRATDPARPASLPVAWEVAEDAAFTRIAAKGAVRTGPERDWTVKVDVGGLKPGRLYFYRFTCGAAVSPTGQGRTLPVGPVPDVVLAVVTCSLYQGGYFNAFEHIAKLDRVDAVVELGDYIYEYGAKPDSYGGAIGAKLGRLHQPPHDIITLADYRTRYAQYRGDPMLQAAHARAPWICIWDDHESANDSWAGGAENHDPKTQGPWRDREANAVRAYFEWMPIREPAPGRAVEAIQRSFDFGTVASLHMIETRLQARSIQLEASRRGDIPLTAYDMSDPKRPKPVTDQAVKDRVMAAAEAGRHPEAPYGVGPDLAALEAYISNPERQMMGVPQEQWLAGELKTSVAAGRPWQVIGNQVVMARLINPNARAVMGDAAVDKLIAGVAPEHRKTAQTFEAFFRWPAPFDLDGWNGYPAARERVYDAIKGSGGGNTVVLAGDSHAFWVNQLFDAAGTVRVAAEFGTSSITSPSIGDEVGGLQLGGIFTAQNKECLFSDQVAKGYILLTLTPKTCTGELVAVPHLDKPYTAKTLARWAVEATPGVGVGVVRKI